MKKTNLNQKLLIVYCILISSILVKGEGSVDFINYPGKRLYLFASQQQQMKVYAGEGEFLNVGASHTGITGGTINVYRPDGTLHTTYDNSGATSGLAIINNDCLLYTSPSPRDRTRSRMPSSA